MPTKWTDSMIASRVMKIYDEIGTMPTVTYLKSTGQNDVSTQISRRGGFIAWAKRLGIEREHSDSDTGWDGETKLCDILHGQGFIAERQKAVKWPYDVLVNGVLRIDCKAAKKVTYDHVTGWFYRIGKAPQADIVALIQMDTGSVFFVPWYHCPQSNVTISESGGKYAKFKDNFNLVLEAAELRKAEKLSTLIQ